MNKKIEVLIDQVNEVRKSQSDNDKYSDVLLLTMNLLLAYDEDNYLDKNDMKDFVSEAIEDMYKNDVEYQDVY